MSVADPWAGAEEDSSAVAALDATCAVVRAGVVGTINANLPCRRRGASCGRKAEAENTRETERKRYLIDLIVLTIDCEEALYNTCPDWMTERWLMCLRPIRFLMVVAQVELNLFRVSKDF